MVVGLLAGLIGGIVVGGVIGPVFEPLTVQMSHIAYSVMPTREVTPETLVELRFRKIISKEEYVNIMRRHGFAEDRAEHFYEARYRLLTAEELTVLKWRGWVDEKEYKERMEKLGLTGKDIELFEKARLYFPSPSDLVRFAVREVYTPEIVKRYGMMEDLPKKFLEEASKAGMTEEQAKNFWAAHWELPSPTQGYEMLFRLHPDLTTFFKERYRAMGLDPEKLTFTLEDLRTLLRTLDVMPYWRDKLVAIAYSPLTRVDLRRMWDLALITAEELEMRGRELGYSPEDAKKYALFAKAYVASVDARAMFKKGWINEEGVRLMMIEAGVPEERVDEWVKRIVKADKSERLEKERDLTRSDIIKGVGKGILTIPQAKELLTRLGYDDWEADFILYVYGAYEAAEHWKLVKEAEEKGLPPEKTAELLKQAEERLKVVEERLRTGFPYGSPETYTEYLRLTEAYKKARGEKALKVTDEMVSLEKEINELRKKIQKLRVSGVPEADIAPFEGLLATKEGRLHALLRQAET